MWLRELQQYHLHTPVVEEADFGSLEIRFVRQPTCGDIPNAAASNASAPPKNAPHCVGSCSVLKLPLVPPLPRVPLRASGVGRMASQLGSCAAAECTGSGSVGCAAALLSPLLPTCMGVTGVSGESAPQHALQVGWSKRELSQE